MMYAETQIYISEDIAIAIVPALIRKHIEFECRPNNNGLCRITTGFNNLGVVNNLIAEQTIKVEEVVTETHRSCIACGFNIDEYAKDQKLCGACTDEKYPVLYLLNSFGASNAMEANGTTYRFCSKLCRDVYRANHRHEEPMAEGSEALQSDDEQCSQCGLWIRW